jgi:hypothetical protein
MKYCQGPKCHEHKTKDRIRGPKGDKHYETRKIKHAYYFESFCSQRCYHDWFDKFGKLAIDHFGRLHEPKRLECDAAWYKASDWRGHYDNRSTQYYFVNDLLGERRPITEAQYDDESFVSP